MAGTTKIQWTDATWSPVTGCDKISPGCDNCYASVFAERWRGIPGHPYEVGFDLTLRPERLDQPSRWKKPRRVFVCSMSDLFHKAIPSDFRRKVFESMIAANHHTYQVLTKRSSIMRRWIREEFPGLPNHIWLGVSVENRAAEVRIEHLRATPAAVRFLSVEPLIEDLGELDLTDIDWVIVGGESGPRFRPMAAEWVRDIRDSCKAQGVAFFFKQWAGRLPKKLGRELDGETWSQYPSVDAPQRSLAL